MWKAISNLLAVAAVAVGLAPFFGCSAPAAQRERLHSSYPLERAEAAVALAEAGDTGAIHQLVNLLEDGDSGVRLYAQLALERLTKQSYGYRYFDDEVVRGEAIERWREALRRGEVAVVKSSGPSTHP